MQDFLKKINPFMIYISTIVMCILAVINMSKSGRIITTAFQDDDAAELMIAGMKTFMIILITLSVIFTAILVSKKSHLYCRSNLWRAFFDYSD